MPPAVVKRSSVPCICPHAVHMRFFRVTAHAQPDARATVEMEPETQTMVLLCCCCAFTSYADRAFLSVTIMPMSVELGWDLDDRAAVMAAFYPGCE